MSQIGDPRADQINVSHGFVACCRWCSSCSLSPLTVAVAFFCVALAIRIGYFQLYFHDPFIGSATGFSIMGTPYSDAYDWDLLAKGLAEGKGFPSAMRPFYSIFLALAYTWVGPSFTVAVFLNLIASALTVSLVYLIGEKAFHWTVGCCAAIVLSMNQSSLMFTFVTCTETVGLMLMVWAVYYLLVGAKERTLLPLLASGVLLGLANLTRPLTLFAVPGYLVCIVLIQRKAGANFRHILQGQLVFILGLAAATGPWLIRQQMVHGLCTISDNSAACLYAATDARYRTWTSDIYIEADGHNVPATPKDRHAYFMRRAKENLLSNPGFMIGNTASTCAQNLVAIANLSRLGIGLSLALLCAPWIGNLRLLVGRRASVRGAALILLAGLLLSVGVPRAVSPATVRWGMICLALALTWRRSALTLVLTNTLVFSVLGIGIFGMTSTGYDRLALMLYWLFALFYFFAAYVVGQGIVHLIASDIRLEAGSPMFTDHDNQGNDHGWLARSLGYVQIALLAFCLISGIRLVDANWFHVPAAATRPELPDQVALRSVDRLNSVLPIAFRTEELNGHAEWYQGVNIYDRKMAFGRLFVARGTMTRHLYHFPYDVRIPLTISDYFKHRDYERTLFRFYGMDVQHRRQQAVMTIFPGRFPNGEIGKDALLVGRVDSTCIDGDLVNGIAWIPWDDAESEPNWSQAIIVSDQRHIERLSQLRRVVVEAVDGSRLK